MTDKTDILQYQLIGRRQNDQKIKLSHQKMLSINGFSHNKFYADNSGLYKIKMIESLPISQLTLIRLPSTSPIKRTVFCDLGNDLPKFSIPVNDETSVDGLISEAIKMMKEKYSGHGFSHQNQSYSLFACKKNGRKISDLPSFQPKQKIMLTGVKAFYLSQRGVDNSTKKTTFTASTKSIQSDIMKVMPKRQEVKPSKHLGCFCFSK